MTEIIPAIGPGLKELLEGNEANEVVIGLICPIGVGRSGVVEQIAAAFPTEDWQTIHHICSSLIEEVVEGECPDGKFKRIEWLMDKGNALRSLSPDCDTIALLAAQAISSSRVKESEEPNFCRRVHIIDSLKHESEIVRLKEIYGGAFYCVSLYAPRPDRLSWLRHNDGFDEREALSLVCRDEHDGSGHHQSTSEAFQLGDVFVSVNAQGKPGQTLKKFLELLLMHPHHTPTPEENGMFAAYSAAMKSGSLSRQVGASLTTAEGELVATGCNDVPAGGGGQYWTGQRDMRDAILGHDSNDTHKIQLIERIMEVLAPGVSPDERYEEGKRRLKPTGLLDLTEFGRDMHAEMAAILSAARRGVPTQGASLFTTTFPCHNCAKHIVAAGIKQVFYIEPYPKSKAVELHRDALETEGSGEAGKVRFLAFEGIGPRRYFDLFSMDLGSGIPKPRKSNGKALNYAPGRVTRTPCEIFSIIGKEKYAARQLADYLPREDLDGPTTAKDATP